MSLLCLFNLLFVISLRSVFLLFGFVFSVRNRLFRSGFNLLYGFCCRAFFKGYFFRFFLGFFFRREFESLRIVADGPGPA